MANRVLHRNPSRLPAKYEDRVFVGGSYSRRHRRLLDDLEAAVRAEGFEPVAGDRFVMDDEQIHDQTLGLLHNCRYAVFEASVLSGALMEIERTRDYGTRTLVLWRTEPGSDWRVSRMLNSFFRSDDLHCQQRSYNRPKDAILELRRWLQARKRHGEILDA